MQSKPLAKVVGENIANRRREIGLTQMVLAERLGIGQDALSRMEKGTISPKIARLRELAAILECSVPFLFREHDSGTDDYLDELTALFCGLERGKQEALVRAIREIVKVVKK